MTSEKYILSEVGPELMLSGFRFYDYNLQPPHPRGWHPVTSRNITETEIHEVHDWLWEMATGRWGSVTHYTPELKQCVWFEKTPDAVAFKLAWGGDR